MQCFNSVEKKNLAGYLPKDKITRREIEKERKKREKKKSYEATIAISWMSLTSLIKILYLIHSISDIPTFIRCGCLNLNAVLI